MEVGRERGVEAVEILGAMHEHRARDVVEAVETIAVQSLLECRGERDRFLRAHAYARATHLIQKLDEHDGPNRVTPSFETAREKRAVERLAPALLSEGDGNVPPSTDHAVASAALRFVQIVVGELDERLGRELLRGGADAE